ncbi:MAG: T9SS type A sorting domain-containing protein [Ignavibacteria bacterium]|nr:T9SS type A sorting domain-containing protein [Ignavibacteria bacterium]
MSRSFAIACMLICGLFCQRTDLTAQVTVRVDTLFRWFPPSLRQINALQTNGDTVVFFSDDADSDSMLVFRSTDKGDSWDSSLHLFFGRYAPGMPFPGFGMYAGAFEPYPTAIYLWRGGVNVTVNYPNSSGVPPDLSVRGFYVHPLNPELTYLRTRNSGTFPGFEFDFLFYRPSDDEPWSMLNVPAHTQGGSRRIQFDFDWGRPERLWVTINGDDLWQVGLPEESYYSDDMGVTWTQVANAYLTLIGLWRTDWGLGDTSEARVGRDLLLVNALTNELIALDWQERIASQVWPESDSATIRVRTGPGPRPNEAVLWSLGFHPSDRDFLCLGARVDTLIGGSWYGRYSFFLTTDRGNTWTLLKIEPLRSSPDTLSSLDTGENYFNGPRVSPGNSQIFIPYFRWYQPRSLGPDSATESGLIRYTLTHSTGVSEVQGNAGVRISPNPADEYLSVRIDAARGIRGIRLVDVLGREQTAVRYLNRAEAEVIVDVGIVLSGSYYVVLETESGVSSAPLTIIH